MLFSVKPKKPSPLIKVKGRLKIFKANHVISQRNKLVSCENAGGGRVNTMCAPRPHTPNFHILFTGSSKSQLISSENSPSMHVFYHKSKAGVFDITFPNQWELFGEENRGILNCRDTHGSSKDYKESKMHKMHKTTCLMC